MIKIYYSNAIGFMLSWGIYEFIMVHFNGED